MAASSVDSSVTPTDAMTPQERRVGVSLASIFGLRMMGLFIILPVFSLYAHQLPGGNDLGLVGLAIGAYGLTQAFLQIPFGMASDRFGRKPVIVFGLLLFVLGSVVAAQAADIWQMVLGRALQGSGAISAAVTALAADLTREQHRTKIMAMIGSTIGLVFAASLVLAPLLYGAIGMSGIFWLVAALALAAIVLLKGTVPNPPHLVAKPVSFSEVLRDKDLLRLNLGIFSLHLIQMAMFVVVPHRLVNEGGLAVAQHWQVYLPVVLLSFVLMVPAIIAAERKQKMKPVFLLAVMLVGLSQLGLALIGGSLWGLVACLFVFFVAFNILEATLPSLISRFAPPPAKGAALGIYNTTQSMGLFLGGAVGGAVAQHFGDAAVSVLTVALAVVWWLIARRMNAPPQVVSVNYEIPDNVDLHTLRDAVMFLPGVREVRFDDASRQLLLKVYAERWDESLLEDLLV